MVLIIDNILTPYEIARYNKINKDLGGELFVWFHAKSEKNRNWKQFPKIDFRYQISGNELFQYSFIQFLHAGREQITRIVCCGWNHPVYWYSLVFSKLYSIRCTLWSGSTKYERSLLRSISISFVRIFISMCDDFITYGSRAKDYLKSLGAKEDKISIYYNSVDVDFFHSKALLLRKRRSVLRKKYLIPLSNRVILFVGQLIRRKGIIELLDAFISESGKHPAMTLLIVGNGALRPKIREVIRSHPESSIIQIDHLEYSQIPETYAISDTLILPSKEEVWGLVVNEAMASMLPVFVSHHAGSAIDLVNSNKTGYIFDPSARGIQKSLKNFRQINMKKLVRMGHNAYLRVQSMSQNNKIY